jgi:aspartate racemase
MKNIRIGVLGGIGPEATHEFYGKLIKELQERGLVKANRDFPQIVINSIPAPELVYESISEENLTMYIDGLKQLDSFGVDFIIMVCNTIYLFYDKLQKQIKTPILNLREEIKRTLDKKRVNSVLILGTPSTVNRGLYKFDNLNCIVPDKLELKELGNAIFNFNLGSKKDNQAERVKKICNKYLGHGKAETVILGCTEVALMLENETFPKVNTIDVLVDATINRFTKYGRMQ